jgi:hypothetical protein
MVCKQQRQQQHEHVVCKQQREHVVYNHQREHVVFTNNNIITWFARGRARGGLTESGGGAVRQHEAGVKPALLHQEGGQLAVRCNKRDEITFEIF